MHENEATIYDIVGSVIFVKKSDNSTMTVSKCIIVKTKLDGKQYNQRINPTIGMHGVIKENATVLVVGE